MSGLGNNDGHLGDLQKYAHRFTENNINGKRLLQMGSEDLKAIGISSHGHLSDFLVCFKAVLDSTPHKNLEYYAPTLPC